MPNVSDDWDVYRQPPEPERCSFCVAEDTHIWVGNPDEPGLDDLLLCDSCFGWSQRLLIGQALPESD